VSNLVLLFVSLCAGIVLGQRQWLRPNTPNILNGVVLFVSLPALILLRVHGIHPKMELIYPALLGLLYVGWLHAPGETIRITEFGSAMGPTIGRAIVAMQNDLNPPLITLVVGLGITLSFLTLPGWWYLLGAV
jgi:predicted permease